MVSVLTVSAVYLMFDKVMAFIIKRRMPKDKSLYLDGGPDTNDTNKKEALLDDGKFREFEKLRAITIGERTAKPSDKTVTDTIKSFADSTRDERINTIATEHTRTDSPRNEKKLRDL